MIIINLEKIVETTGLEINTLRVELLYTFCHSSIYLQALPIDSLTYEVDTKGQKNSYHDLLANLIYIPGNISIGLIEHLLSNGATTKIKIEGVIIEIQKLAEYNENLPALSAEMLVFLIKNGLNHENIAHELYDHLNEDELDAIEQIFIFLKEFDQDTLGAVEPLLSKAVLKPIIKVNGVTEILIPYEILQYLTNNKALSHKLLMELNILFDYIDLTKSLVESGVDVNAKVYNKKLTYLDLALRCSSYESIKYLATKIENSVEPVSYLLYIVANKLSKAVSIIKMLPAPDEECTIASYKAEAKQENICLEQIKIIIDYYHFVQDCAYTIDHPENSLLSKDEIIILASEDKNINLSNYDSKNFINKYAYDVPEIALISRKYEAVINHIRDGYDIKATNKFGLSFLKFFIISEQFMDDDTDQKYALLNLVVEKINMVGVDISNWDEHIFN